MIKYCNINRLAVAKKTHLEDKKELAGVGKADLIV